MKRVLLVVLMAITAVAVFATPEEEEEGHEIRVFTWKTSDQYLNIPNMESFDLDGTTVIWQTGGDRHTVLQADAAAGTVPDVFHLEYGQEIERYAELMQPIEPYADPDLGRGWKEELFMPGIVAETNAWGEEWCGMPTGLVANSMMFYNQDLFDEYGLEVPTTYEDLKAVAQVFNENDVIPIAVGGNPSWPDWFLFMSVMLDFGGEAYYAAQKGEGSFNEPWMVGAFETWKDMVDEGVIVRDYLAIPHWNDMIDAFVEGRAAMLQTGSWNLQFWAVSSYTDRIAGRNIGIARWPDFNGDGMVSPVWGGPDLWTGFSATTEYPEETYKVIKWLSIGDAYTTFLSSLLTLPDTLEIQADWTFINEVRDLADPAHLRQLYDSVVADISENMVPSRGPYNQFFYQVLDKNMDAVALGDLSPAEAAVAMDSEFRELNSW